MVIPTRAPRATPAQPARTDKAALFLVAVAEGVLDAVPLAFLLEAAAAAVVAGGTGAACTSSSRSGRLGGKRSCGLSSDLGFNIVGEGTSHAVESELGREGKGGVLGLSGILK